MNYYYSISLVFAFNLFGVDLELWCNSGHI